MRMPKKFTVRDLAGKRGFDHSGWLMERSGSLDWPVFRKKSFFGVKGVFLFRFATDCPNAIIVGKPLPLFGALVEEVGPLEILLQYTFKSSLPASPLKLRLVACNTTDCRSWVMNLRYGIEKHEWGPSDPETQRNVALDLQRLILCHGHTTAAWLCSEPGRNKLAKEKVKQQNVGARPVAKSQRRRQTSYSSNSDSECGDQRELDRPSWCSGEKFEAVLNSRVSAIGVGIVRDNALHALKVSAVLDQGAAATWNTNNPQSQIEQNDLIVSVNGVKDDIEHMIAECCKPGTLIFSVQKP